MYNEKNSNFIKYDRNKAEIACLDELVPQDHLVRKIDKTIDFSFIHDLTRDLYCQDNGRPCVDPVILFKLIFINYIFGINSLRKTCEETKVNLAYRWFLGLGLSDKIPNHSTISQNYIRKFSNTNIFDMIFSRVLEELLFNNVIDPEVIFVDGTHIKANANKNKRIKKQVKIITDKYHKELENEVNEFREMNGRDKYPSDDEDFGDGNYTIDEKTGEVKEVKNKNTKEITVSTVDPDAGLFVKGEHERQFAYTAQVACDKNGWALGFDLNPGNMHDSAAFLPFFDRLQPKFHASIWCADAGYANNLIAHHVQNNNCHFLVPYTRPKGATTTFSKREFDYYDEIDQYRCPNKKWLIPWNISKEGNIEYKIHKTDCGNCPFKKECLKNYSFKTITRHIYEDCRLVANDFRLSEIGKTIYPMRKTTIERLFAVGKEQHGLRFTRFIGLEKNHNFLALLLACLNIKKLALLLVKRERKLKNKLTSIA